MAVSSSKTPDTLHCDRGLRRQTIVRSLLADVFQGRLAAGQHLVTQDLADRFGVSHTPIREALIVLEGMGVLDIVPNRGAVVRNVTARDIREICQVRRALECEAVRRACGHIDPVSLRDIRDELRRFFRKTSGTAVRAPSGARSTARFVARARETDNRLHDLIADACRNAFLAKELDRLKTLFRAFRDVSWEFETSRNARNARSARDTQDSRTDRGRLAEEAREHLAIVEALLAGDGLAAARAMSHHIRSGMKYWSRSFQDRFEPQPPNPFPDASGRHATSKRNGRSNNGSGHAHEKNGRSRRVSGKLSRGGNGKR